MQRHVGPSHGLGRSSAEPWDGVIAGAGTQSLRPCCLCVFIPLHASMERALPGREAPLREVFFRCSVLALAPCGTVRMPATAVQTPCAQPG